MDADQLEQCLIAFALTEIAEFARVQIDVHGPEQPALFIDDGKREQLVQREEFASVEDRRRVRHGDHLADHDLANRALETAEQEAARRHDAAQAAVVVHDVEINDTPLWRLLSHGCERLADRLADVQARDVRAQMTRD